MRFIDECELRVEAGNGGKGAVAFRREKYIPFGGPAGGDGGRGGDIVLVADSGLGTLYDLIHQRTVRADPGQNGMGKDCYGRAAKDVEVRVPVGTIVFDAETQEKICELTRPQERFVIAKGGEGGRGNRHFTTPVDRAPRHAEPGAPGESRSLRLELKVMADVGLLGFPNVGKSTFISRVSAARPRVADYPFTTLVPHLGVVRADEDTTFVVADIPGLIEGAHTGHGLGDRFLRHVSRTSLLLHLLDASSMSGRDPLADYDVINRELALFDPALAAKTQIVAANKSDAAAAESLAALQQRFAARGVPLWIISAATG